MADRAVPLLCRLLVVAESPALPPVEPVSAGYRPQQVALIDDGDGWAVNADPVVFAGLPECTAVGVLLTAGCPHRQLWSIRAAAFTDVPAGGELVVPARVLRVRRCEAARVGVLCG